MEQEQNAKTAVQTFLDTLLRLEEWVKENQPEHRKYYSNEQMHEIAGIIESVEGLSAQDANSARWYKLGLIHGAEIKSKAKRCE